MLGAVDFGVADDGERAGDEQAAQVAVTLFGDTAKSVLAAAAWIAPLNRGSLNSAHIRGTHVPVEEPSTASQADIFDDLKVRAPGSAQDRHGPVRKSTQPPVGLERYVRQRGAVALE